MPIVVGTIAVMVAGAQPAIGIVTPRAKKRPPAKGASRGLHGAIAPAVVHAPTAIAIFVAAEMSKVIDGLVPTRVGVHEGVVRACAEGRPSSLEKAYTPDGYSPWGSFIPPYFLLDEKVNKVIKAQRSFCPLWPIACFLGKVGKAPLQKNYAIAHSPHRWLAVVPSHRASLMASLLRFS
jgi:hypothetical protein